MDKERQKRVFPSRFSLLNRVKPGAVNLKVYRGDALVQGDVWGSEAGRVPAGHPDVTGVVKELWLRGEMMAGPMCALTTCRSGARIHIRTS